MPFKLLLLLSLTTTNVVAQLPVDNPYFTKYGIEDHWTNKLKWGVVTNATKIESLIDQKGNVDSLVLTRAMSEISKLGGGVIYFPPGNYFFKFNLMMHTEVIIRGASPVGVLNAVDKQYSLTTKFNFPKYEPVFTGNGASSLKAFKKISSGDTSKTNFGIVNIDINRAVVDFSRTGNGNVIVFGIRSNNAATFHANSTRWFNRDKQGWQKYPKITEFNILINTYKNALIANCRLNDSITDDFEMPNFQTNDGYIFEENIKFQYGFHNGITLKYSKKNGIDIQVINNFVRCGGPVKINIIPAASIPLKDNILEDIPVQDLIDVNGGYSKIFQKKVNDAFEKSLFINQLDTLTYELLKPVNYDKNKKYPLVLFYPAVADFSNPLVHFVHIFINKQPENQDFFVLVSNPLRGENVDLTRVKLRYNIPATIQLLNKLQQEYNIDSKEISVAGLSTGGGAAWNTIIDYSKFFSNAFIMSSVWRLTNDNLASLKNIKFVISQSNDDPFIPVQYSRYGVNQLRKSGSQVQYYEYQGLEHFSWLGLCNEPGFINKLFNKAPDKK